MSAPGTGRRVLRGLFLAVKWLWILTLAGLLVAAFVFKTPWKANALLAILIVMPTIVPRRARKYVYLVFVTIFLSLAVWVFLPEDDTGWRTYTLDEEIAAYRAKYAVPDDQNAAAIYEELLKTYDGSRFTFPKLTEEQLDDPNAGPNVARALLEAQPPNTFYPDFWTDELDDLTLFERWSGADYAELAAWLREKHGETIAALLEASKRPYCRFEPSFDLVDLPHARYSAIRDWAQLLMRKANNDWGDGRMEEAVEMYLAALRMAALYAAYPPNGVVMGVDLTPRLFPAVRSFIMNAPLTAGQLNRLGEAIEDVSFDWQGSWPGYLEQKKLESQHFYLGLIYEINEAGKTRFARSDKDPVRDKFIIDAHEAPHARIHAKIAGIFCWFWMPVNPQEAAAAFGRAFDALKPLGEPDYDWHEEKQFSWTGLRLNFEGFAESLAWVNKNTRLHSLFVQTFAEKKGARLLIALRQHQNSTGGLPADLEELKELVAPGLLVDPITNGPYVYGLTGETFTLYSMGRNGVDDGGLLDRKSGADDVRIWPLPVYARKAEQPAELQEGEADDE